MPRITKSYSDKFRIRRTRLGKGLFARTRFRKGQLIGEITGKIIIDAEYQSRHCIELSETHVLEPGPPFRYMNHCCEPNCELFSWKDDRLRVLAQALRTIQPGEELTFDYAWEAEAAIPCRCAAETCRGWIVAAEELRRLRRRLALSAKI